MHRGKVWVLNSGYGEFGVAEANFLPHRTLPGWTRGLCFVKNYAFIGTSRVIPRFCHYAPGLAVDSSVCGVHALDLKSGEVVGSLVWERGNQIFGIESVPVAMSHGFPFLAPTGRGGRAKKKEAEERALFYSFDQRRRH
jgi:hypothetical protein